MKANFKKAYQALRELGVPVFTNVDNRGNFSISAEDGYEWADYYTEARDWVFGVSPELESVLSAHGLWCEWENPGKLNVYQG